MKTSKINLDIDFIGGQGSLTKMEEKELSNFFKSRKLSLGKPIPTNVVASINAST